MSGREERPPADDDRELELLKAVAQAWHGHSGNPGPTREFDAAAGRRGGHERRRPTRFRLEALRQRQAEAAARWDFGQSLWDSYEIVTLSKQLESGLAPEDQHAVDGGEGSGTRGKRESKNSLRRLFRISSGGSKSSAFPEKTAVEG